MIKFTFIVRKERRKEETFPYLLGVSIAAKDWSHWAEEIKEGLQAQSSVPSDVQDTQHILKKKMREESNDFT